MPLPLTVETNTSRIERPSPISVILGRNGSGKSRFLRSFSALRGRDSFLVEYLSPERAGTFEPEAGIENALRGDSGWLSGHRLVNQAENFKRASAVRLKELAMMFALRMETDKDLRRSERTFSTDVLAKINKLLTNVQIERSGGQDFAFKTLAGEQLNAKSLSSGESEIIALVTEVLHFFSLLDPNRLGLLLIDEPDVHLHPDLQGRFARFLLEEIDGLTPVARDSLVIMIATHSTPLVCALAASPHCTIGVKHFDVDLVVQRSIGRGLQRTARFFGHPLSACLADEPLMILEGEDDERVWQQAARSSRGKMRGFPVLADDVQSLHQIETVVSDLLLGVYDHPTAISLRDGDGVREHLDATGCVKRFRLQCYSIENLLLSDEVLRDFGLDWEAFKAAGRKWLAANASHEHSSTFAALLDRADRGRDMKIKSIRNIVCSVMGTTKPWEVVVGQTIGRLPFEAGHSKTEFGLIALVGKEALMALGALSMDYAED